MARYSNLDKRMKNYEAVSKTKLMRRTPVVVRVDGRAFHTFTKHFKKPFDKILMKTMQETTRYLCKNIPGCVLGYTQSDEISLVLVDYDTLEKDAWFDYEVQKLCSIIASMTTMKFNKLFEKNVAEEYATSTFDYDEEDYLTALSKAANNGACFDTRVYNIPKEEVANYIYWRQSDATRNSIQMVGHTYFSEKEIHGKSTREIQDMLMDEYNVNWDNYPVPCKRGVCVVKKPVLAVPDKKVWVIDKNIPIFKGNDRDYINREVLYTGY